MRNNTFPMRRAVLCMAALWSALGLRQVEAQTFRFLSNTASVTGSYSADTGLTLVRTETIRHRQAASSYIVTFPPGQSGSFTNRQLRSGANALQYQVYDNLTARNVLKDLTAGPTSVEVLSGSFVASGSTWTTQNQSFTIYVPAGQAPPAGTYTDSLTLGLYPGTAAAPGTRADTLPYTVSVTVTKALAISLVPHNAPYDAASTALTLDFGTLSTSGVMSADLVAKSNAVYSVRVSSANGGLLVTTGSADTVPYVFRVNGTPVALPAGAAQIIATGAPATPSGGTVYLFGFTIGNVGWPSDGTYTDVLTISATAP